MPACLQRHLRQIKYENGCINIPPCIGLFVPGIWLRLFFALIPYQPLHTGVTGALVSGLKGVGYIYPMMKVIQVVCGLSLMFNRYAPFSAVVVFPISLNVFLFHTILVPSGWYIGCLLLFPNLLLGWGWRKYYAGLFTKVTT